MSKNGTLISIVENQEGKNPTVITRDNRFPVSDEGADIARGLVSGSSSYAVFGHIDTIATVETIVWETGMPATFTVPNSIQLSIVSSSASDTGDIKIKYLDGNLIAQEEIVTLTGVTPALTIATDVRAINNAYSITGPFIGNISISNAGTLYAYIPAGGIQFDTSLHRVPAGKRLMINSMYAGSISGTSSAKSVVKLESTQINGDSFASQGYLHPVGAVAIQDGSATLAGFSPLAVSAGEWVCFTALSDKNAVITAGFFGWLEDE